MLPKFTGRNVSITEISETTGKSPQLIRVGLQRGIFNFGYAFVNDGSSEYNEICPSAVRTWKSAYNHSKPLWNIRMKDIRAAHLEQTIKDAKVGDDTKGRMKSLYNQMFRFAMKHEIVNKDYAALCSPVKKTKKSEPKVPFSEEEIQILWDNIDFAFTDMVLIGI